MALKGLLNSVYTIVFGAYGGEACHCGLAAQNGNQGQTGKSGGTGGGFQMPLHYPRYKKADYEKMEEWKLDLLLREYGFSFQGTVEEKREFAIGAFVWPDQMDDN